jgi:PEP-CTERM motif
MNRLTHKLTRLACTALLCATLGAAEADNFSASVQGSSEIAEVVDPNGPVVRVQTLAEGSGTWGLLTYHSGDVIDLSTGLGTGTNRFVAANGDELHGSFSVQMRPGADASLFDLIGQVSFNGGTGAFLGATGDASFIGSGQFISASLALTHFHFNGNVTAVPEPGAWALILAGLGGLAALARRRRQDCPRGQPPMRSSSAPSALQHCPPVQAAHLFWEQHRWCCPAIWRLCREGQARWVRQARGGD